MSGKSNFFKFLFLSAVLGSTAYAQTPAAPPAPAAVERQIQVFTTNGGSYLGVQLQDVNRENFGKYGLKEVRGVAIEKVAENSPAKQAGMQDGDVIVKFDGEQVTSVRKLQRLIGEVAPDHQAKVTVLRNGGERDLNVTVGKRPGASFQTGSFGSIPRVSLPGIPEFPSNTMPRVTIPRRSEDFEVFSTVPNSDNLVWNFFSGRRIGVSTTNLGKQLGEYFGVTDGKGVLINSVAENSPAAKAGLKAGDVIIEADGKSVSSPGELTRALGDKDKKTVNLTILRNKTRQNVTVEPEESKDVLKMTPGVRVQTAPRTMLRAVPGAVTISGAPFIEL